MKSYWSKIYYADQIEYYAQIEGDHLLFGHRGAPGEALLARVPLDEALTDEALGKSIAAELGENAWQEIQDEVRERCSRPERE